jgi:hypothetical protein
MKRTTIAATAMLVLSAGLAGLPATAQTISVQECLNQALDRYNSTVRECDRMANWWDRMACRMKALNDYYVDRNLCYTAPLPVHPMPAPAVKPPSGLIA